LGESWGSREGGTLSKSRVEKKEKEAERGSRGVYSRVRARRFSGGEKGRNLSNQGNVIGRKKRGERLNSGGGVNNALRWRGVLLEKNTSFDHGGEKIVREKRAAPFLLAGT